MELLKPKLMTVSPSKVSVRISKLSDAPMYAKVLIYGRSGVGKTYLACTAAKPLLLLSEYTISIPTLQAVYRQRGIDPDVLEVTSWNDYEEAHRYAKANLNKYSTVVLDGLTDLNYRIMREVLEEGVSGRTNHDVDMLDPREYQKLSNRTLYAIKLFRDLPVDVVVTALEQDIKEEMTVLPLVIPKSLAHMLASQFNCVGNLVVQYKGNKEVRELYLASRVDREGKSLGGMLPNVVEDPDLGVLLEQAKKAMRSSQDGKEDGINGVTTTQAEQANN